MKGPSEERTEDPKGPSGERIENPDEILHRQVHPQWIEKGRATSMAFLVNARSAWTPTRNDQGMLSVSQGSLTTAKASYEFHIRKVRPDNRRLQSGGVWSVCVSECEVANLTAHDDPMFVKCISSSGNIEEVKDEAHAIIDFREHKEKKYKITADKLRRYANDRGPSFIPQGEEEEDQLDLFSMHEE